VAATHEQIAAQTGLSDRQVKRGVNELRRMGLLLSNRQAGSSHYWLTPEAVAGAGLEEPDC
jgi:DNA-binding IclR family transcriptional regulator